jgi:hypothetical protein
MIPKKQNTDTAKKQSARFIETARQLGTDERPEEFEKVMKKVIKPHRTKTAKACSSRS